MHYLITLALLLALACPAAADTLDTPVGTGRQDGVLLEDAWLPCDADADWVGGSLYFTCPSQFVVRGVGPDDRLFPIAGTGRRGIASAPPVMGDALSTSLNGLRDLGRSRFGSTFFLNSNYLYRERNGALDIVASMSQGFGVAACDQFTFVTKGTTVEAYDGSCGGPTCPPVRVIPGIPGNGASDVAVSDDCSLLLVLTYTQGVYRVSPDNSLTRVAGGGGNLGSPVGAFEAKFSSPNGIDIAPGGQSFVVSDWGGYRVVEVKNGIATAILGNGLPINPDAPPAMPTPGVTQCTALSIGAPSTVWVESDGTVGAIAGGRLFRCNRDAGTVATATPTPPPATQTATRPPATSTASPSRTATAPPTATRTAPPTATAPPTMTATAIPIPTCRAGERPSCDL